MEDGLGSDPGLGQQPAGLAPRILDHRQEEMLRRDVLVLKDVGFLFRLAENPLQALREADFPAAGLRPPAQDRLQALLEASLGYAELGQNGPNDVFLLRQENRQQVLRRHLGVAELVGSGLGGLDGFLRHDRQFFPSHGATPLRRRTAVL